MNLYLIERPDDRGDYDEWDGFVIAADSPERARTIAAEKADAYLMLHPDVDQSTREWTQQAKDFLGTEYSTCTLIGTTDLPEGIVLGSYSAG